MAGIDLNALMGMIGSDGVQTIAKMTKTSGSKVNAVLTDALPVLVGKMSDNASTKAGAESLNKALNEHKTGEVIDAAAFLKSADSDDGKKILGHILGADEAAATKALSKKSGVSGSKVGTILSLVAPLLLSQLGNKKDDDTSSGLGGLLGGLLGGNSSNAGSTLLGGLLGSQSQSSGGLLGGLLGGNTQSQSSGSGLGGLLGGLFGGNQEEESSGSLIGGLGNLAMGLFGDSEALSAKEETTSSGKKKTGKKTGTTSAKKKTGTTASTGKKTAKKTGTATAKKTGTTSTGKKTAKKTGSK